ncbi:protein FATTY ACID EXPORT 1, chloroplastic isoform X2 [Actinidia eriantha]|uniref:protein FATTY ACID EXPORT 1, chloroplastic isoform X2 n=1 Tax=Actinidia eriantha TaxID=165200 RepID=UPI00258DC0C9|nr:protein FATTY ACID EXPORT 1, chloroplastic isoform X2 [Actinidia eriantha]
MSSAICQLSCFSSINRRSHLHIRSVPCPTLRSKVLFVMCSDGSGTGTSGSQTKTSLSYTPDASISHIEGSAKSYTTAEENVNGNGMSEPVQEHVVTQQKGTAKIHDFCFGIPFGGLVLSGGLAGFVFTRNLTTLINGVLFGGALLALSTFSLKVWRQGKSSFPFILGQAVLAAALLLKNFQTYSMTKKLFPTGFYIGISAAMICFYAYVVMSGGNPPPKKLRSSVAVES